MLNLADAASPLHQELSVTIIRDPITISLHTTVKDAIALMSKARAFCAADITEQSEAEHVKQDARASCVIVVESSQVVGILTERDVVQLCADQRSLKGVSVGQIMTSPVVTLQESRFTDLFSVINFLQQCSIRHLPLVDGQGNLVGLLTHETLRQVLQPTDLLRLRLVREVMTPKVITVAPTDSLLWVAQCMATQRVSSVVVVNERPGAVPVPVGIVTERDLVQFQALELEFERYVAAQVMSYPVITVPENDTLLTVQQLMKRHLIRRLVVVGESGDLQGIVTQTNVLQALNPLELYIYKLTEVLEAQVRQLETEKVELLESRNLELEKEVAARTENLEKQLQREQVVAHLASQIRSSLSLQTILDAAVAQIRQIIGCDRVNIWKFEPDWSTVVVAESTHSPHSLLGERVHDQCYQQHITQVYSQGHVRVVSDIHATEMTDCHRELLIRLQTRAKVLLPLFCGEELWGLLNVAESTQPREWQPDEIELLRNLTTQITIAVQQASIHEQLQAELQERHHIETQLRQSTDRLQQAQRIAHVGNWELDLQHNTLHWSDEVFRIFEIDPQAFGASYEAFLQLVHPADRPMVDDAYTQHLRHRQPYSVVHRLQMADGQVKYVREQCETNFSADGTPLLSRGTVQDITQQQEAEIRRDLAEASLRQVIEGTAAFTGQEFFPALVHHIAEALGIRYVVVSQALDAGFQVLAFYADGKLRAPLFLPYEAVPCCYQSLQTGRCCHPANLQALYPDQSLFAELAADSYLGVGLHNAAGEATGNLCILHDRPLADPVWAETLLSIFAARAGAELERIVTAQALEQLNAELETRVAQRTAELAERETFLQDFLDNANDLIQMVDVHTGRFKFVNRAWREVLGYTTAEVEQLTLFDVVTPDCLAHCQQVLEQIRAGTLTRLEQVELTFVHQSGQPVLVEGSINCRFEPDAQGNQRPVSTRAILRDVSDRRQAEQERQRLLQELAGFKRGLDEAAIVAITDAEGVITYVNQRFVEISGYSEAESVGQTHHIVKSGVHPPSFFADLWDTIKQGKTWRGEVCNRAKDGRLYWVSSTIVPFLNIHGKPERYLSVRFDITERRQSQLLLQENLQLLQGITQAQAQFITAQSRLEIFEGLLTTLLDVTNSEYGFIGEVLFRDDGTASMEESFMKIRGVPYLKTHSITNIAWDEITHQFYEDHYEQGMEFTNMNTLFGATIMTGKPVIANNPSTDPRRGGNPAGHPPLNAFLGLPFFSGSTLIGMVGIANRPGGYTKEQVTTLNPLLVTCSTLIEGYRQDRRRREAEMALQESRQFLQTVLDTVPLRVFWKDVNSKYLGANQRFLRDAGLRLDAELIGKNDFDLPWGATEADLYRADDRAVMESGEARLGILETQHQQGGAEIWLETSKLPLRNLAGKIIGMLGTYQDVTDRRNAELVLQRQLAAIEAAVDGIAILQDRRYLYLNSSHAKMFGYESADELINQGWAILYSPEELERFEQEVFPVLLEQKSWQGEATATRKDGTTFPEQLSLTFAADNLLICVCQDISDRKAAEAELRRTNTELERATRLKDEFLANMSHELRTPLNAILGMTEGLQEEVFGIVNERQLYALETVEKSANHLLALINDILDVAKIESGQITLDCTYVSVEQLCASSVAFVKQQAFKKNIQLKTEIPTHLPEILVDEIRMRQVLLNLLNNAVKFTLEGGLITLRVSQISPAVGASGAPLLRLSIQDTGIGIAPENISKLFKPFVQIDSALNRKQAGTGLGLALVKQIVELHGGQVVLSSELGVGSCFTIELPYSPRQTPALLPKNAAAPDGDRPTLQDRELPPAQAPLVLLVEDNPANVSTISCYLKAKAYRIIHANDGEESIDLALSHQPDLILMDIQMPGMDGLEAMRIIRLQESLAATPIIAITALAMKGDRDRCLAAGANDYLSKPIKLKQLDITIRTLLFEHGEGIRIR